MALVAVQGLSNDLDFFNRIKDQTGVTIEANIEDIKDGVYNDFKIKFPGYTDPVSGTEVSGDEEFRKVDNVYVFSVFGGRTSVCFIDVSKKFLVLCKPITDESLYSGAKNMHEYIPNMIVTLKDDITEQISSRKENHNMYTKFNIGTSNKVDVATNKNFKLFPVYYYEKCTIIPNLFFVYSRTFDMGDIYTDSYNRVFHTFGGHFVYCDEHERLNLV